MTINSSAELFLSAMIFDGVFERHPNLKGISMEHGAFWLPSWLKALDYTASLFKRKREFKELPSETAKKHIKVSPFASKRRNFYMFFGSFRRQFFELSLSLKQRCSVIQGL